MRTGLALLAAVILFVILYPYIFETDSEDVDQANTGLFTGILNFFFGAESSPSSPTSSTGGQGGSGQSGSGQSGSGQSGSGQSGSGQSGSGQSGSGQSGSGQSGSGQSGSGQSGSGQSGSGQSGSGQSGSGQSGSGQSGSGQSGSGQSGNGQSGNSQSGSGQSGSGQSGSGQSGSGQSGSGQGGTGDNNNGDNNNGDNAGIAGTDLQNGDIIRLKNMNISCQPGKEYLTGCRSGGNRDVYTLDDCASDDCDLWEVEDLGNNKIMLKNLNESCQPGKEYLTGCRSEGNRYVYTLDDCASDNCDVWEVINEGDNKIKLKNQNVSCQPGKEYLTGCRAEGNRHVFTLEDCASDDCDVWEVEFVDGVL